MVAGHLLPQIQILFCREEDIHWCRPVGGFVHTAGLGPMRGEGPVLRHFVGRASHLRPADTRLLAKTTSLRITAVMATFAGFPVSTSRL